MSAPRVLPADLYDALEFSALAFGGIGAGVWYKSTEGGLAPVCIVGHAWAIDSSHGPAFDLHDAGIWEMDSDDAVNNINRARGMPVTARVPFGKWCAALGVVRGE